MKNGLFLEITYFDIKMLLKLRSKYVVKYESILFQWKRKFIMISLSNLFRISLSYAFDIQLTVGNISYLVLNSDETLFYSILFFIVNISSSLQKFKDVLYSLLEFYCSKHYRFIYKLISFGRWHWIWLAGIFCYKGSILFQECNLCVTTYHVTSHVSNHCLYISHFFFGSQYWNQKIIPWIFWIA